METNEGQYKDSIDQMASSNQVTIDLARNLSILSLFKLFKMLCYGLLAVAGGLHNIAQAVREHDLNNRRY